MTAMEGVVDMGAAGTAFPQLYRPVQTLGSHQLYRKYTGAPKRKRAAAKAKKYKAQRSYWRKRYWRRRITGRGAYVMDPEASAGVRYGGYLGAKAGEWLGGAAHGLFNRLTGLGDYKVRRNVFLEGRLPEVVNQPAGGGTIIRFQEYLGDIVTGAANTFTKQSFLLNAANGKTFPFLSQIAANYEQFDFEGLVFEFRSTSADSLNSTNTALGTVMMATQYDVADEEFESKLDMLNYEFSSSCKPSCNLAHLIECDPRQTTVNELYSLSTFVTPPANADLRLYHLGRFTIATTGFQAANVNIGELHLTYQVRLLKPKLYVSLGNFNAYAFAQLGDGTAGVYTTPAPFGTPTVISSSQLTAIGVTMSADTITFPIVTARLAYRIEIEWDGTIGQVFATPTLSLTRLTVTNAEYAPPAGTTTLSVIAVIGVELDGSAFANSVRFIGAVLPTGNQLLRLRIIQVPAALNAA